MSAIRIHGKGRGFARSLRLVVAEITLDYGSGPMAAEIVKVIGSRKTTFQLWIGKGSYITDCKSEEQLRSHMLATGYRIL